MALLKFTGEVTVSRSRCSCMAYRKGENNPVSAKKGPLNKFTSSMAGCSESCTELTGKNGSCHECLWLGAQLLLSELWQGRCSSARLGGSGAHSSLGAQPSEALRLICRWINSEPQSRVLWFYWHIVGEAKILSFPITWPCWVFTDKKGSLQKYSGKFKANGEKQNSFWLNFLSLKWEHVVLTMHFLTRGSPVLNF